MFENLTEEAKLLLAIALLEYSVNARLSDDTCGEMISRLKQPNGLDDVLYFLSLNTDYSGKIPRPVNYKEVI